MPNLANVADVEVVHILTDGILPWLRCNCARVYSVDGNFFYLCKMYTLILSPFLSNRRELGLIHPKHFSHDFIYQSRLCIFGCRFSSESHLFRLFFAVRCAMVDSGFLHSYKPMPKLCRLRFNMVKNCSRVNTRV